MPCQICFEDDASIAANADIGGALCRRSCTAQVCVACLARHVEVSLAGFYAGVLPRIRCPICLLPMRVSRWTQPLTAEPTAEKLATLLNKYETLCKQSCSLTPPCCHKASYTHLPVCDEHAKHIDHFSDDADEFQPDFIAFRKLVARFCGHHLDAQDVLAYAVEHSKKNDLQALMECTLPRIADSERRGRLLLAFVHKFPNIKTRCHKRAMCFNCKRDGHHNRCAEFDHALDESQCLVRCRSCHVMLMKVEGCNYVVCVCGFGMSWSNEVLDRRVNAWIQTYKPLLSTPIARWMWRIRLNKALANIESAAIWRAYFLAHPEERLVAQEEEAAFFMIDVCE